MVLCLFCDKEVAKEQLFAHVCQDVLYSRNRCTDCRLRSYSSAEMYAHSNETGHCVVLNEAWSDYKEEMVRKLYADSLNHSQKKGKEEEVKGQDRDRQQASLSVSGGASTSVNSYTPLDAAFLSSLAQGTPEMVDDSDRRFADLSNQAAVQESVEMQTSSDTPKVSCRVCPTNAPVENDYSGHRSHVYQAHPPPPGVTKPQEQDHLASMIKACFPTATILNDLTCHFEGCGTVVKFGSQGGKCAQEQHVRSTHASVMLTCPIGDCVHTILRGDMDALRRHVRKEHGGVNKLAGEAKEQHKKQRRELELKVAPMFKRCFPFLPGETSAQHSTQMADDSASDDGDDNDEGGEDVETMEPKRKRTFMTFEWQ